MLVLGSVHICTTLTSHNGEACHALNGPQDRFLEVQDLISAPWNNIHPPDKVTLLLLFEKKPATAEGGVVTSSPFFTEFLPIISWLAASLENFQPFQETSFESSDAKELGAGKS